MGSCSCFISETSNGAGRPRNWWIIDLAPSLSPVTQAALIKHTCEQKPGWEWSKAQRHQPLIHNFSTKSFLNPQYLMTHIIPQPVRSLLLVDFLQAALGTFEIISANAIFFPLKQPWQKRPRRLRPLAKARVVTCDFWSDVGQTQWVHRSTGIRECTFFSLTWLLTMTAAPLTWSRLSEEWGVFLQVTGNVQQFARTVVCFIQYFAFLFETPTSCPEQNKCSNQGRGASPNKGPALSSERRGCSLYAVSLRRMTTFGERAGTSNVTFSNPNLWGTPLSGSSMGR